MIKIAGFHFFLLISCPGVIAPDCFSGTYPAACGVETVESQWVSSKACQGAPSTIYSFYTLYAPKQTFVGNKVVGPAVCRVDSYL